MSAEKERLLGSARCENRQVFGFPPTLGDLSVILNLISVQLTTYTVWPVSSIALLLGGGD